MKNNKLQKVLLCLCVAGALAACAPTGTDLAKVLYTIKEDFFLAAYCPGNVDGLPRTPPLFLLAEDVKVKLKTHVTATGNVVVAPATFAGSFGAMLGSDQTQMITVTLTPLVVAPGNITINPDTDEEIPDVKTVALWPLWDEQYARFGDFVSYKTKHEENWIKYADVEGIRIQNPYALTDDAEEYIKKKCQERFGAS